MAQMWGVTNTQDSLATVRANCQLAFRHSHLRKTFKGVAEIVPSVQPADKMEID